MRSRHDQSLISYREIQGRVRQTAGLLHHQGVRAGDRVALVLRTGPEFYDFLLGAQLLGAVPVPLYPPVRFGDLGGWVAKTRDLCARAGAELVVVDAMLAPVLQGQGLPHLLAADAERADPVDVREPSADQTALIQFTSGTTGHPKGVCLSHAQILHNATAIRDSVLEAWPETDGLRHVSASWLPLYHDMGLIGALVTSLVHRAELNLIGPELFLADPRVWLQTISRYRVTVSPAPNFAFGYVADRLAAADVDDLDLSSWRVALNGAEQVTRRSIARFRSLLEPRGLRAEALTPVYGISEASLIVTASPLRRAAEPRRFGREALESGVAVPPSEGTSATELYSLGTPVADAELAVHDGEGGALPEGRVGRICIRGPSLMQGYAGDLATSRSRRDRSAWFDTGDLGFLLDGELYITGRRKDTIVVRGRNHAPEALETAASDVSGVRRGRCVAFSVPGPDTEQVVVVVERARGSSPDADPDVVESVRRAVLRRTSLRPAVVLVQAPGTIPRTTNGKLRRSEARHQFLSTRPADTGPVREVAP